MNKKKNLATPRRPFLILALLLLLLLGLVSACTAAPLNRYGLPDRHFYRSCNSLPRRSLCFHVQSFHRHHLPILPPPPPPDDEIDPRYGVEKRLVPSGPNPLHN